MDKAVVNGGWHDKKLSCIVQYTAMHDGCVITVYIKQENTNEWQICKGKVRVEGAIHLLQVTSSICMYFCMRNSVYEEKCQE